MTTATFEISASAPAVSTGRPQTGNATDWAGLWFDILEKDAGEFVGMRAGRLVPGSKEQAWRFDSHACHDGLGWFATLLRKHAPGADISIPQLKETGRPSRLAQARAFLRLMARKPQTAGMWSTFDANWRAPSAGLSHASRAVAAHALTVGQTNRLSEHARELRVSLNSLLLATLGQVSEPLLQGGPAFWMVPVNMRGPVNLEDETANHSSYLQIKTGGDVSAQHLHDQVKVALGRLEHWGGWLFANVGRVVGYAGMKWLYQREIARTNGRPWVGAFSNLGSWNNCGQWFVCPPVAKTCPLGVGVVICEGCLSLTIDAHPSITRDASWTRTLVDNWVAELARLID
jgi:hypothetical protein